MEFSNEMDILLFKAFPNVCLCDAHTHFTFVLLSDILKVILFSDGQRTHLFHYSPFAFRRVPRAYVSF